MSTLKSRLNRKLLSRAALAVVAASSISPHLAHAADGTWIADADGTWTDAGNWLNGTVANGGGNALIGNFNTSSPVGQFTAPHTITLTSPISLSSLSFTSPFTTNFNGPSTLSVTNINTNSSTVFSAQSMDVPGQFQPGDIFNVSLTSGAPTKIGLAPITLKGTNTFGGAMSINQGAVYVTDNNDAAFGNASNSINLAGGAVLGNTSTSGATFTTSRNITLTGTGTAEFRNLAPMVLRGTLSSTNSNGLLHRGSGNGNGTLTMTGTASYSGPTVIRDNETIRLAESGNMPTSSQYLLDGTLIVDNTLTAYANRLNSNGTIDSNGGGITLLGNASTAITQNVGSIILDGGMSQITTINQGASIALHAPVLTRVGRSTAFIQGNHLGTISIAPPANSFLLTTAPAAIGGNGAVGTTNINIIPWLIGADGTTTLNGSNNSFLTYGASGLRPLDIATEYSTALATGANVRINAATANSSPVTVNSLINPGFALSGGGTVTVTSGAVAITGQGATIGTPINFGSTEGIIHATSSGTISGVISGNNGLTKSGFNTLNLTGANTYNGGTTIVAGTVAVPGNVGSSNAPLGSASVTLYGGSYASAGLARLYSLPVGAATNQTYTIAQTINVNNTTVDSAAAVGLSAASVAQHDSLTLNQSINVNGGFLRFEGDPGATITVSGSISGTGGLTDAFASRVVLFNNINTYTGGTVIHDGTWLVGGNQPMGSGGFVTFANTALPTTSNPFPGAIGPFGGQASIFNSVIVSALGPADGAGYLGVPIVGSAPFSFNGQMNLNGEERTFNIQNTAVVGFDSILNGGFDKRGPGRASFNDTNYFTGNTKVETGTLTYAFSQSNPSKLYVFAGANAEMVNGGTINLKLPAIDLAGTAAAPAGTFNVNSHAFNVGGATPFSTVQSYIKYARDNGQWDRPGITSALAKPAGATLKPTGIGAITGAEFATTTSATLFSGYAFSSTDTLVKYTWNGDADLNGKINADDYSHIDSGFQNQHTAGFVYDWFHGDFDYNGTINADDYALIDSAYQQQSGTLREALAFAETGVMPSGEIPDSVQVVIDHANEFGKAYVNAFISQNVPEPAAVFFVVGGCCSHLLHRRSRRAMNA